MRITILLAFFIVTHCCGQLYGQIQIKRTDSLYNCSRNLSYSLAHKSETGAHDTSTFVTTIPSLAQKLDNIIWVKGEFLNLTSENIILGVFNATIDSIAIYIKNGNELQPLALLGDKFPFYDRKYKNEDFLVDLPSSTSASTFYLRIKVKELTEIPVFLGTPSAFEDKLDEVDRGVSIFFGAMMILIIYNLFICVATKEINYLIYAIANSLALLLILTLDGYSFHYFWPVSPAFNDLIPSIAALNSAVYCLFFIAFTNLKFYEPKWRTYFFGVIIFFVALVPINLFSYNYLASVLYQVWAIPYIFIQLYVVRKVIKKGYTPAKYFFWGSCFYSSGGLLFIIYNLNMLPLDFPVGIYLKVTLVLEACLLSFALAAKLNFLKSENIRITTDSNRNLKESNVKLKDALDSLDLFTYRSAHDIRGPLMRLKGLINLISADQQYYEVYADKLMRTADTMESILDKHIILNALKNYNVRLSDVNGTNVIERIRIDMKLPADSLAIIGTDTSFYTDEYLLGVIFKELITNSVSFRREETPLKIQILTTKNKGRIVIQHSDNGKGIDQSIRNKIFEIFFRGSQISQGSGIGLTIVNEAVQHLGGRIALKESQEGLTVFEIDMPDLSRTRADFQHSDIISVENIS
ncbi:hypothetical protein BH09BAC3_BH09BAC3_12820 [soil metagenome]